VPRVLVVEQSQLLADLIQQVLCDDGYQVELFTGIDPAAIRQTIEGSEPDCVLLNGLGGEGYGEAWELAAWLQHRPCRVPIIMLTGLAADAAEARQGASARSRAAGFSAVLEKPFELEELLAAVSRAVRGDPG
jgi:DNA-binding response OmpR family regulator